MRKTLVLLLVVCAIIGAAAGGWAASSSAGAPAVVAIGPDGYIDGGLNCVDVGPCP